MCILFFSFTSYSVVFCAIMGMAVSNSRKINSFFMICSIVIVSATKILIIIKIGRIGVDKKTAQSIFYGFLGQPLGFCTGRRERKKACLLRGDKPRDYIGYDEGYRSSPVYWPTKKMAPVGRWVIM